MYGACAEWDDFIVNFNNYRLDEYQYSDILYSETDMSYQSVTYLCWEGRVLQCGFDPTSGMMELSGDGLSLACIEGGDPSTNPDGWTIIDGMLAEEIEDFSTRFPHCLPNTEMDYASASADEQALIDSLTYYELAETSLMYAACWYNDATPGWECWPEEYAEELPIFVNRYGDLCTNMWEEVEEGMGRILLSFHDGIFDPSIAAIDVDTLPEDYPDNVANLTSFLAKEDFDDYTANQVQVDGTDESGSPCTACVGFTTYWDFLTAVARTPAFCNGAAGGLYSRFDAAALCAKEAAACFATIITQTNAWDDSMVDAAGEPVPMEKQGLAFTAEPMCDASNGGDPTSADCQGLPGVDFNSWDDYYADKFMDPNSEHFVPRGAGWIYGVDMYYWFDKIVFGDDSIIGAPSLVQTDPVTWWMSGMLTWMIPMHGKPAPHNIITGQWEPTWAEAEYGITDGFGAVSALFYGDSQCGMTGHPVANARTRIYEALMNDFEAADGSWTAMDTVYDWEANGCESSARTPFPDYGDYS